jgi:hypothetical protein
MGIVLGEFRPNVMKQSQDIEHLRDVLVKNLIEYSETLSDYKRANYCFDLYKQAVRNLIRRGDEGLSVLKTLLDDSREAVKINVAVNILPYCPKEALKVLIDAANSPEFSPLALVTLRHWREGNYVDPLTGKLMRLPQ